VDSEAEVAWKLRYDLVMIDNSGGTYGWGVGANCTKNSTFAACNHEKSRVARMIRDADPSKPVTVYRETLCHDGSAPLPSPTTLWFNPLTSKQVKMADIWFTDAAGILQPGVCDLRKTVAQDYILVHNYFGEGLEFLHDNNSESCRHCMLAKVGHIRSARMNSRFVNAICPACSDGDVHRLRGCDGSAYV
jgi:hypothetical protein